MILTVDDLADFVELAGGTEFDVLGSDEVGIFGHEDLADGAEVEGFRMIAEVFAVDAGPDQTAISVDVDLGHAEFRGLQELVVVNTLGTGKVSAGGIDAGNFFLRNGGGTVHDEREARDALLDLGQDSGNRRI